MHKLLLAVMLLAFVGRLTAFSCDFGRFGCIPSCMFQNCATGYCESGTCTCSRCANGSPITGHIGVSLGGGGAVPVDGGEFLGLSNSLEVPEEEEDVEEEEGFEGEEGEEGGEQ